VVAVAAGLVAVTLPVAVAGTFGLPLLDGAGWPHEAWLYGVIAGSVGFIVALTIRVATPSLEEIPATGTVPSSAPAVPAASSPAASSPPVPTGR
jgi:hypothetical protein